MRLKLLCFISLIFISFSLFSQKYTLSGYIKDKQSGEELLGANIIIKDQNIGTTTNASGFYTLSVPAGEYEITYSFIGYGEITEKVKLNSNKSLNISLESSAIITQEVIVSGEKNKNVEDSKMSVIKLPVEAIKTLPAFMGEVDILKTLQLLPGIQSAGDGNSGYYVRGGGPDQNLVLLDEAIVYNAAHLFGFFSVFNADAIKDMEIYKGGMPAEYGGRISSVLDISMKNGNMNKFQVEGGIGTIASRLTVQGPIVKEKASFILSARRTYIDILLQPFIKSSSPFKGSGYYFYDLNTKFNYRFSDKDRLYFSGYYGKDIFDFKTKEAGFNMKIPWGNATSSIRWNHLFNSKFFSNSTLVLSDYKFQTAVEMGDKDKPNEGIRFIQDSGVRDYYFKQDFTYLPNPKHNIKFGANYIYHIFSPNSVSANLGETEFDFSSAQKQKAHEAAIYIGDDFKISDRLTIYAGFRAAIFNQVGKFTRYVKDEDLMNNIDTIVYKKGENVAFYDSYEPRASIKFSLDKNSSLKASFMQNKQFIHLASLSASTLPTDLWVPCSDVVKPQGGRQYAIGYFRNFFNDHFETSVEAYYKNLYDLIEYADGALPGDDVNDNADNYFIFGDGYSYGAELFLKKRTGRFTGWIGYTWSKTERIFDDINDGEAFPAKYDRRHDLSLTTTYQITEKLDASLVFVFATGNTTTLPIARYMIDGDLISEYGPRNSYRMQPYHRLDISLTYQHKKTDKWESSWNFSVFNVYNRKNPYFIYLEDKGSVESGNFTTKAKQISLIPILPSITWNFKF
ncbi:MAG: TonB-dependent receptor [Bacteroidales bacterium]|nr:TonB-dependent receptor [Bacteroidales bacterium]